MEDNFFCQAIYKYISTIASQEIKALVTHKALQLSIPKINVETMGKFDALSITWYQHYYALLIISILYIYTGIESVKNDHKLQYNEEKDRLQLEEAPS